MKQLFIADHGNADNALKRRWYAKHSTLAKPSTIYLRYQ